MKLVELCLLVCRLGPSFRLPRGLRRLYVYFRLMIADNTTSRREAHCMAEEEVPILQGNIRRSFRQENYLLDWRRDAS
jgi:hypothetical protein